MSHEDERYKAMKVFRNLSLVDKKVDLPALKKVAANPFLVDNLSAHYGEGMNPRTCDGCKGTGFSHVYCERGSQPVLDNIDLCPPCLMKVQFGLAPCESILEVEFLNVKVDCEKMENAVFISDQQNTPVRCCNCSRKTLSWFTWDETELCPICYAINQKGSLFVENIVDLLKSHVDIVRILAESDQSRMAQEQLRITYEFLVCWNGEGEFRDVFQRWLAVHYHQHIPTIQIVEITEEQPPNTTSTA